MSNPGIYSNDYNLSIDFYKGPIRSNDINNGKFHRPPLALADPRKKNFEYYNDLL